MDNAAFTQTSSDEAVETASVPVPDARATPRFTLLIRAAKLITPQGEFVCVVRDASENGVSVKLFHQLPSGSPVELHMPQGGVYEIQKVWEHDSEAGFKFVNSVDVDDLIAGASEFPKRGMRLGLFFPVTLSTLKQSSDAIVSNLSQQGARFESEEIFAIAQNLRIKCAEGGSALQDVRAKVRWRRGSEYGVVFEDTLSLGDFARFAARLQCPALLG